MKFVKKIFSSKFNLKAMQAFEKDTKNYDRYRIIRQFLVSCHEDSLQVTSIDKSHLHPNQISPIESIEREK